MRSRARAAAEENVSSLDIPAVPPAGIAPDGAN